MDRRSGGSLARLGLTGSWAEATLSELGWWSGEKPTDGAAPIMWALARSPDPDLALRTVERLYAAVADRPALDAALRSDVALRGRLLALLGSSTALGDHLVTHPDRWHRLAGGGPQATHDPLVTMLTAVGAMSPLLLFPGDLFGGPHHAPTLEGQYVLKDVVLVSAGLVIGGALQGRRNASEHALRDRQQR